MGRVLQSGPLVTVYIPCRNYGRFLNNALESMRDQLHTNWELFIVDEASEDDTQIIAHYFRSRVPQQVEVIHNAKPIGLQRVANHVLSLAQGKYIVRLDADDWFDESALLLMTSKLESDSNLGLVYGNYFYTEENGEVIGFERRHRLGEEDTSNHLPPHGACTMVRTNLLKSVGGYSEEITAQDGWELWFKMLQRAQAASLEAPIFYYRQHGNSLSRDSKRLLHARAQIFSKLRNQNSGGYRPSCLAVIPAKESYPDFEGVPYRKIKNKTLLQIAIDEAQRAECVSDVMVSSESPLVLEHAQELEQSRLVRPHLRALRPQSQRQPTIRPQDILLHACNAYSEQKGFYPDIVLFLSLHAPLRKAKHIDKAFNVLLVKVADSVVSVCEEREPIFTHGPNGLNLLNPGRFEGLSYEREKLYGFNGAIIITWMENLKGSTLFGEKIGYIEMGREESVQIKQVSNLSLLMPNITGAE